MKLCFCLLLLILVVPVSAGTYLHQGDSVYYGDRVDLTGVSGWQCTVARWAPGTNDLQPPTEIRDVCSFAENIEITPERFPVGKWWKWDGKIYGSENDLAFKVIGYRPTPTPTVVVNITSTPTVYNTTALPTVTETPQQTHTVIKTTQTSVVSAAAEVFLPTPTTSGAPQAFIPPNLPPLPIIIIFVILLGLLIYWFLKGTI